jgi:hypothetical protein
MMSDKYTIELVDGKLTVLNAEGEGITGQQAQVLITNLMNAYPLSGKVYVALKYEEGQPIYKIGITGQELSARMSQIRFDESDPTIALIHVIQCETMRQARLLERWLHNHFKCENVRGEWFRLTTNQLNWLCDQNISPIDVSDNPIIPLESDAAKLLTLLHVMALNSNQSQLIDNLDDLLKLNREQVREMMAANEIDAFIEGFKVMSKEMAAFVVRELAATIGVQWEPPTS